MNRKAIALLVLLLWVAGFGWMLRRSLGGDNVNRRLNEVALRIQPATFYYTLSYNGKKIGAASSAIDTLVAALVSEDYYTGTFPSGDSLLPVSARLRSRLSRGFRLTDIALRLDRPGKTAKMSGFVQGDTTLVLVDGDSASKSTHIIGLHGPLLPPGLVGVALLLGEEPKPGLSGKFFVFDPTDATPKQQSVRVTADSLFTVVDSAAFDSAGKWSAAHSDTVRAWRLGGDTRDLTIWVDAEGRVVEGTAPNGLLLRRTAFELAFEKAKKK